MRRGQGLVHAVVTEPVGSIAGPPAEGILGGTMSVRIEWRSGAFANVVVSGLTTAPIVRPGDTVRFQGLRQDEPARFRAESLRIASTGDQPASQWRAANRLSPVLLALLLLATAFMVFLVAARSPWQ